MANMETSKQILLLKLRAYESFDTLDSWYEINSMSKLSLSLKTQNEIKLNKVFGKNYYLANEELEDKDIGHINMILDEIAILISEVTMSIKLA
jgi:hypothetical protein